MKIIEKLRKQGKYLLEKKNLKQGLQKTRSLETEQRERETGKLGNKI